MRNFKSRKGRVARAIIFAMGFMVLYWAVWIAILPRYSVYTMCTLSDMRKSENIDIVFVGSSMTYTKINPEVVWRNMGLRAFDMCSSGQGLSGDYYMLRETLKYHAPEYVVLEVGRGTLQGYESDRRGSKGASSANIALTEHLDKLDSNFWDIFLYSYAPSRWFYALCGVYHYRDNFTYDRLRERLGGEYVKVAKCEPIGDYRGSGFVAGNGSNGDGEVIVGEPVQDGEPCPESLMFLEKIYDLCMENGCRLVLLSSPGTDPVYGVYRASYDAMHDYCVNYAREKDVGYVDMNLNREYMSVKDDREDFIDAGHMNYDGATKYTGILTRYLLNGSAGDFFDNYEDMMAYRGGLEHQEDTTYGQRY